MLRAASERAFGGIPLIALIDVGRAILTVDRKWRMQAEHYCAVF